MQRTRVNKGDELTPADRCLYRRLSLQPGGREFEPPQVHQSFQAFTRYFWFFVYSSVDDFVDGGTLTVPQTEHHLETPDCVEDQISFKHPRGGHYHYSTSGKKVY